MKYLLFLLAIFINGMAVGQTYGQQITELPMAASPLFKWSLLWSGSWEEKTSTSLFDDTLAGTLHNRGELKLHLVQPGLLLRIQVLGRHPLDSSLEPPWGDPEKMITHYMGGLYHKPTGSRLLYGVIDEYGLSARIRNPWIRSPPYTENHKPLMADLKTAASSTKEDEIYMYLSSPYLNAAPNMKLRGFISAQSEADYQSPEAGQAMSGGLDFSFAKKTALLLEMFYTGKTLPPSRAGTWFSNPPKLTEREFHLYAGGLLFTCPAFSISSDYAVSETFAWGEDIYCNLGITITPLLPVGNRARPLAVSFAADSAGERFVNRDGVNISEGFRGAAKIELKGRYNSLIRLDSVLRAPAFGEDFNRSSTGFYWRFPAVPANRIQNIFPVRLTRLSFSADRNAANLLKISDSFSGSIGLNIYMPAIINSGEKPKRATSPLGITFSAAIKGISSADEKITFYPIPDESWNHDSTSLGCELFWSPRFQRNGMRSIPGNLQFRSKVGVTVYPEKPDSVPLDLISEEKWDLSFSTAIRFKQGRFSLKIASPDFPEKWYWTFTWRLEKQEKR